MRLVQFHMRPIVTTKTTPIFQTPLLPASLADVALIDAPTCAAAGAMSLSWWHEEVRAGRAPAPVIRKPRCTRWRVVDVRNYLVKLAEEGSDDELANAVVQRARKASAAAKAARKKEAA